MKSIIGIEQSKLILNKRTTGHHLQLRIIFTYYQLQTIQIV